jgi:hypothetical protein
MLQTILNDIPDGENKNKIINTRIATLKNALRALLKWNKLFYIYKAQSSTGSTSPGRAGSRGSNLVIASVGPT